MAMENTSVVSSEKRIAVVTGGNKGIGFEICRQLASNNKLIILTARNESQGLEAVKKLNGFGLTNVVFHQLDVKDPTSAARLANYVETQFKKLDILVNNAGVNGTIIHCDELRAFKESGYQVCDENAHLLANKVFEEPYNLGKDCIETNYYGTKRVTEAFLPLLQLSNSPRIVNITSFYGELHWIHNEKLKAELLDNDNLTEERIDRITQQFLRDFETNNLSKNGWPLTTAAYKISKIVITAYSRLIARKFPKILANCVHPGYVKTDITSNFGHMTPEDGAKAPVLVALLGDDGPSGVYFNQMQISSF